MLTCNTFVYIHTTKTILAFKTRQTIATITSGQIYALGVFVTKMPMRTTFDSTFVDILTVCSVTKVTGVAGAFKFSTQIIAHGVLVTVMTLGTKITARTVVAATVVYWKLFR